MELRPRLLALALAALAGPAAAQEAPSVATGIGGFLALGWGSTAQDVINAYGTPMMDQTTADSVRVVVYKDNVLGKSVLALFYVDPKKGLLKGVYTSPYGEGDDCETVFRKFRQFVGRLYPDIRPEEERKQDDPAQPFCAAAADGKASWKVSWTDPKTGNSVHLTLEPDEEQVEVAYQARGFKPVSP